MDADEKREYMRRWWAEHPDYKRAYRVAHRTPEAIRLAALTPEQVRENHRAAGRNWKLAHREQNNALKRASYHRTKVLRPKKPTRSVEELRLADLARQKKYRDAHPGLSAARRKAWAARNREHVRAYKRAHPYDFAPYYAKHKDRLNANGAAYRRAHPEVKRQSEANRRARKRGAGGSHTYAEWQAKLAEFGWRCKYCGRADRKLTRDHVVPVSRGGSDFITNIVPACGPCNSSKRAKIIAA